MASIEWTKITPSMIVVETRAGWRVGKKTVIWGSRDSKRAQTWLFRRAKADKVKSRKKLKKLSGGFTRGKTIHPTKSRAMKVVRSAKSVDLPTRLVKVKGGWRVDKKF